MAIDQNDALFNLIGTTYGGDGQTTFALPDLQSRVPVHVGPGFALGQLAGVESVTLTTNQIPAHSMCRRLIYLRQLIQPGWRCMGIHKSTTLYDNTPPSIAMAPAAIGSAGDRSPTTT